MKEYVLRNARVVTPTTVMHGHVLVHDGLVADVDEGDIQPTAALECIDCEGDYLLPGFVELHTDNLEKHLVPRPKVVWPQAEPAFFAHDAQIVAAGITTVFDALSVGEYHDKGRIAMLGRGVDALNHCRQSGMLRADHLLHLRCEVADPRMRDLFFPLSDTPCLKLVSLMDHTPGQRQWRDTTAYRTYYSNIKSWTDEEFTAMMHELEEVRDSCANDNAASVMEFCRQRHLPMASHDDTLVEHVEEALSNGISISEFPTTTEAACCASENGMLVMMGAPNVVRGGSHSGNASALDVAKEGHLGALSSDYVPASLLAAVFELAAKEIMPLPAAVSIPDAVRTWSASTIWTTCRWSAMSGVRACRCTDARHTHLCHGTVGIRQGQPAVGPAAPVARPAGSLCPALHQPSCLRRGRTAYGPFRREHPFHGGSGAPGHALEQPRLPVRHRPLHRRQSGARHLRDRQRFSGISAGSPAALS